MKKTNFDRYLEEQLQDPAFAARFERAGEAWDVALQIARLRQQAGLFPEGSSETPQYFSAADQPAGISRLRRTFIGDAASRCRRARCSDSHRIRTNHESNKEVCSRTTRTLRRETPHFETEMSCFNWPTSILVAAAMLHAA